MEDFIYWKVENNKCKYYYIISLQNKYKVIKALLVSTNKGYLLIN